MELHGTFGVVLNSYKRKRSKDERSEKGLKLVRESLDGGVSEGKEYKKRKSGGYNTENESLLEENSDASLDTKALMSYDEFKAGNFLPEEILLRNTQQTPLSVDDFKARLATFDLRRWSRKPDCIASFHCARFGWELCEMQRVDETFDALVCVSCKQVIPISGDSNAYSSMPLLLQNGVQLRNAIEDTCHRACCLWRKYFSPVTILSLPKGFDMYYFLKNGVLSFKEPATFVRLNSHYTDILNQLDLSWMEGIIGNSASCYEKPSESESDFSSKYQRMKCFLLLNGWSREASKVDDGVACHLCIRQIPLWMYKSVNTIGEVADLPSPPPSPPICGPKCLEFDPVNNHWWWCPWRRFLEFSEAADIKSNAINESDFFEKRFEDSSFLKVQAGAEDYQRLKDLIQKECLQAASIKEGQVVSRQVVSTVGSIMDEFLSPPRRPIRTPLSFDACASPSRESTSNSDDGSIVEDKDKPIDNNETSGTLYKCC